MTQVRFNITFLNLVSNVSMELNNCDVFKNQFLKNELNVRLCMGNFFICNTKVGLCLTVGHTNTTNCFLFHIQSTLANQTNSLDNLRKVLVRGLILLKNIVWERVKQSNLFLHLQGGGQLQGHRYRGVVRVKNSVWPGGGATTILGRVREGHPSRPARGCGGALQAPPPGSGAESQKPTIFVE